MVSCLYHERVQHEVNIKVDAAPDDVFAVVADLGHYDQLLDIVHKTDVEPIPAPRPTDADIADEITDGAPAWSVTLRAKLGPLARSKRLRMVRALHQPPGAVRFERQELDGREHSTWTLSVTVAPTPTGSQVIMALEYGGGLWSSALGGILETQVERASANLRRMVTTG